MVGNVSDTFFMQCAGPYETPPDSPSSFEPSDAPCYQAGDTSGPLARISV